MSRVRLGDPRYRNCADRETLATRLLLDERHPIEVASICGVSLEYVENLERMIAKRDAQAAHERAYVHGIDVGGDA